MATPWPRCWASSFHTEIRLERISLGVNLSTRFRPQIHMSSKSLLPWNGSGRSLLTDETWLIGLIISFHSLTGLLVTTLNGSLGTWSPVRFLRAQARDPTKYSVGITVGCVVVPQSMAYAKLAELDPQFGLYSSFMGVLIYWFFATSKDITIGVSPA